MFLTTKQLYKIKEAEALLTIIGEAPENKFSLIL